MFSFQAILKPYWVINGFIYFVMTRFSPHGAV